MRTTFLPAILIGTSALCSCGGHSGSFFAPPPTYTVGGTVNGLVGSGLTLTRNGATIGRAANGTYPDLGLGPLSPGQAYDISVVTQPLSPSQTCVVSNGKGTIGNANVTNVQVTCTTNVSRFVYVVNNGSNSISAYTMDATTGALTAFASLSISAGAPYFVAVDPQSRYLYLTNGGSNNISAYTIGAGTGALTAVNGAPFPTGTHPVSVSIHPSGTLVYVMNQSDGTISAYSQDPANGALLAVAGSPFATGSNPFSATAPAFGNPLFDNFLYVSSGANNIWAYTINFNSGGGGPGLTGALTAMSGSPFAAGTKPVSMIADPLGNFIYAVNQGDGTVSAYLFDSSKGSLTPIVGSPFAAGGSPAAATIDTFGRFAYVANMADGTVSAYQIDHSTGALRAVAGSPFAAGNGPGSLVVDNLGKFLYVANSASNNISAFAIDPNSGALSPISGSPFTSGTAPASIVVSD
jgi:6-phosphogluconolactonase